MSFLFYERKLNTNLSFISGDLPFQGNYLIAITHAHTHTSSNVTVTNINKKHKTCCRRVLWKTLTWFYFRRFFRFRASLTKQYFISGLCHGFTFWTTTNTNLHVILVAFLAGTASQCKTFFSFAGGKSPHQSCLKRKKTINVTLCLKFAVLPGVSDHTATSRIAPQGDSSSFFKTLILWVSTKQRFNSKEELIFLFVAVAHLICIKRLHNFICSLKYNTSGKLLNNSRNY